MNNNRFLFSGTKFYFGNLSSDCSVSELVADLDFCITAAAQLGSVYRKAYTLTNRPAGCFYVTREPKEVYFNFANPSETQNIKPNSGGVCREGNLYI